jgi:hypothetical protein
MNRESTTGGDGGVSSDESPARRCPNVKARWILLFIAAASVSAFPIETSRLVALSAARVPGKSSFAGAWEGKMNNIPGIDLKIDEVGGKFSGAIVFYYQERSNPGEPWHVAGGSPVPLLVPHVEGKKTVTFEVQHHKCHGCTELGPNVKFRMEIVGSDEARLWKLENHDASGDLGPGLKLVRRTELASPPKPAVGK